MPPITVTREQDVNVQLATAVGTKTPIKVDVSAADYNVTVPIKLISSTGGNTIMVDITAADGTTITNVPIPAGVFPILNVVKIKRVGTDATNIVLWPKED